MDVEDIEAFQCHASVQITLSKWYWCGDVSYKVLSVMWWKNETISWQITAVWYNSRDSKCKSSKNSLLTLSNPYWYV